MELSPTPFSVKRKSFFVFWILDDLANALDQSETLLHRRHVRILDNADDWLIESRIIEVMCEMHL